jgi:hypothetical protein
VQDSKQHLDASATRNLVVAVDASRTAGKLVKWTLENVAKAGDSIMVLHVLPSAHRSTEGIQVYADALLGIQPRISYADIQARQQEKHAALEQFITELAPEDGARIVTLRSPSAACSAQLSAVQP